jgi:hypothetical protein
VKSPVAMPDMYVAAQQFELQRVDYGAPEASGRIGGVQAGFPLWSAVWTLGPDARRQFRRMAGMAFRASRSHEAVRRARPHTGLSEALSRRVRRVRSVYRDCVEWSETINADGDSELTLHLGAAAAGLVLSQGDYIDFRWSATETSVSGLPWRAMVRVVTGDTADGSGDLTVIVEPSVPTAVPGTAVAHLDSPGCTMALVLDQTNLGPVDRLYSIAGGQITAIQDIRE